MIIDSDNLFGIYRGVVENNDDPDEAGKCQIRILGIHPASKDPVSGVPTENLPWAEPCTPIFGGISQVGIFGVPCQGAHVFLFFEAGNRTQPRYFATAPGMPLEPPTSASGFYDPDEVYPKEFGTEPDWYKAQGFASGSEPTYVDSFAIIDKAGNRIEMDSTPGQENVLIGVSSGACIVFNKDGSQETHLAKGTQKTYVGNEVKINGGNRDTIVTGDSVETVGKQYSTVLTDAKNIIMGARDRLIMGIDNKVCGGMSYQSKGDTDIKAAGDMDLISDGNVQLKSNTWNVKIRATAQNIKMQALLGSVDGLSRSVSSMALLNASYGGQVLTSTGGGIVTNISSFVMTRVSSSVITWISAPIIIIG